MNTDTLFLGDGNVDPIGSCESVAGHNSVAIPHKLALVVVKNAWVHESLLEDPRAAIERRHFETIPPQVDVV